MFSQNVVLLKGNRIKRRNDTEGVRKKNVKGIHRVPVPIMIQILSERSKSKPGCFDNCINIPSSFPVYGFYGNASNITGFSHMPGCFPTSSTLARLFSCYSRYASSSFRKQREHFESPTRFTLRDNLASSQLQWPT